MEDSDDYEILPKKEIEQLRKDVHSLKGNSLMEGDKGRQLVQSIDRLTISVNRLIAILDDAQKDIIDEYQRAKPAQKINQIMDQNETIAKALLSINDNINSLKGKTLPTSGIGMGNMQQPQMSPAGSLNSISTPPQPPPMQQFTPQPMPPLNDAQMNAFPPMNDFSSMNSAPPMNDMPPMGNMPGGLPPMDNFAKPKKKFLGLI